MSTRIVFCGGAPQTRPPPPTVVARKNRLGLERFRQLAAAGYHYIPVYSEQPNDAGEPSDVLYQLTEGKGRFLLESFEQGHQRSRYSFIGWNSVVDPKSLG